MKGRNVVIVPGAAAKENVEAARAQRAVANRATKQR